MPVLKTDYMKTHVLILCGLIFSASAIGQKTSLKYPLIKIGSLKEAAYDTIRIKAYVFDVYVCPPCPEGAQCKPCMENHLTVVEEKFRDPQKVSLDSRVRIFAEKPDLLEVGKRYVFLVSFRNKMMGPSDNLKLVSFKPL